MSKLVRMFVCIPFGMFEMFIIKVFHGKSVRLPLLCAISPLSEITIERRGRIDIGRKFRIRGGARIRVRDNGNLIIGDNVFINHNCIITCHEKISIGKDVQFSPNVMIYDHDHDYKSLHRDKEQKFICSPIIIGEGVWIGANTVILRGTVIGDNCVIAAGSVLKGKYEKNSLIYQKRATNSKAF